MNIITGSSSSRYERHPLFLFAVLPVSFFFILAAWSPPLMYDILADWYGSWQQRIFAFVCHQQLDRSFSFNGVPLAVCSRCTGIYTGLFTGLLVFSFFYGLILKAEPYILRIFLVLSLAVLLDGMANLLQVWQSAAEFRLLIGGSWGLLTGGVLVWALITPITQKKGAICDGTC